MSEALYPGAFHATVPVPPDADIQLRFQAWAGLVAPPQLSNEFDTLRRRERAAATLDQFRSHVSASLFFDDIVYPAPEGLQRFRVKSERAWRLDLAENAPAVPADVAAV